MASPPRAENDSEFSSALKTGFALACFAAARSQRLLDVALDLKRHAPPGCEAAAGDGGGDGADGRGAAFSALLIRALSLSRGFDGPIKAWVTACNDPLPFGGVASCVRLVIKAAPELCRATSLRLDAWAAAAVAHLDYAVAFAITTGIRATPASEEVLGAAHALKLVKSLALYPGLRGGEVVFGPEQVAARGDAIAALIRAGVESSLLAAVDAPWCVATKLGWLCFLLFKVSRIISTLSLVRPSRLAARAIYTLRMILFYRVSEAGEWLTPKIASVLPALLFATRYAGDVVFEPSRVPADAPSWPALLLSDAIGPQLCCAALVDPRTPLAQLPMLLQRGGCLFGADQALRIADTCLRHPMCWAALCDPPAQSRCPAALSNLALAHACGWAGNTAGSLRALRLLAGPGRRVELCVAAGLGGCSTADTERRCGAACDAPWAVWPCRGAGTPPFFRSPVDAAPPRPQAEWRDAARGALPPRGAGSCPVEALWMLLSVAEQLTPEAAVRRVVNNIMRNVVARNGDGAASPPAPPPSLATLCARALGSSVDFSACGLWCHRRAQSFAHSLHAAAVARGEARPPFRWILYPEKDAHNACPPPRPMEAPYSLLELFDVACDARVMHVRQAHEAIVASASAAIVAIRAGRPIDGLGEACLSVDAAPPLRPSSWQTRECLFAGASSFRRAGGEGSALVDLHTEKMAAAAAERRRRRSREAFERALCACFEKPIAERAALEAAVHPGFG